MFGSCQTGCLQYSMTNSDSDSTAKTFNCQNNVKSDCSCFVYISQILEIPSLGGWRFCLWASICLRVSFYALINFRLAEVPHQLLCGCAAASADFLFAYLPRLNQHTHTHTHPHKEQHSTHSQPQRTKSPNTFLLGITHILQRAGPFPPFSAFPDLQPTHCMCDFFCCHLTRGMPHLSTQWANPPASPCPFVTPTSPICLVAVLRLFMFICWYNLVTLFAYNLRLVVRLLLLLFHRVRPLLALETWKSSLQRLSSC